jgi:hypothetical protein
MAVQDLEKIEQKIDRAEAGAIAISDNVGGVMFENMSGVLEFAKLMSVSQTAIPKHLRGNPGGCLAVTIQALEWRMSPFSVANQSYEVNDRIAYQSMLIHAVVEARAKLKQRLRARYEGEGDNLCCIVSGQFEHETEPLEYRSPPVGKIKVKNSPLWTSDVQQQLWYFSTRAWARRYCPEVLLSIYTEEELREVGPDNARDITPRPDVAKRLTGKKGRGFDKDHVDGQIGKEAGVAEVVEQPTTEVQPVATQAPQVEPVMLGDAGEALRADGRDAAKKGQAALIKWWKHDLTKAQRDELEGYKDSILKPMADEAEKKAA